MSVVYRIVNEVTQRTYIGATRGRLDRRACNHLSQLRNGKHGNPELQADWLQYGADAFRFEVVEDLGDTIHTREREQAWIDQYEGNIYNRNAAGANMKEENGYVLPRLRELRRARIWTQQELADKAVLPRLTIVRAERGERVRVATVRKIADALGVSPAELVGG